MRNTISTIVIVAMIIVGLAIVPVASLVTAQVLPDPTYLGYGDHDIDITLGMGEVSIFVIPLEMGDKINVNLEVGSGGAVDFFLMDNYTMYIMSEEGGLFDEDSELVFLEDGTKRDTYQISYQHTANFDDTLFLLIDNSGLTETGATPTGDVKVSGSIDVKESIWTLQNIVITLVIVAVIIIIFVGIKLPAKKKKEDERRVAVRKANLAKHHKQAGHKKQVRKVRRRSTVKQIKRKPKR